MIVTDTKGEVLTLVSVPSFDPNLFINGANEKITAVLEDDNKPLFNRAIGGAYQPGSVYKPVVAIAGLEEGTIDKYYSYDDPGVLSIDTPYGNFSYSNWYWTQYGGREGEIGVSRAITRSTDTFFYKLGELIGVDKLNEWSQKFGLNEKTGIDLPGETVGLVPSPEWKEQTKGERWFLGNTYHMSIGQGDLALTPIAINQAISVVASEGLLCEPKIAQSGKENCAELPISEQSYNLVKEGMKGACMQGGTGFTFFDFEEKEGITVGCKTGTAETGISDATHAWFVSFAPLGEPEIVSTVLVEKGGEGSRVAGPVAREIFNYWFGRNE